jgi:cytochrome P450
VANVFVGPEIAQSRKVIDTFISATADFGQMLSKVFHKASFWRTFMDRANYKVLNPLQIHVRTLVEASTPVILERRRQEAEATEQGIEWKRPVDILQKLLDNFEKYHFVDLEDVCGHLLLLVLASVHTTTDTSTNLLYYMAAFPEYMDKLYEEQQMVLDTIQQEREQRRQELRQKGEPISGEDLDPAHDRDLSAAAIKKMVYMDSFVREVFRYRNERLFLIHRARKGVRLSSGIVISKGSYVVINMHSAHQGPDQGEDVTEFRPWRFVGKSKSATKAGADFLPFGMGR